MKNHTDKVWDVFVRLFHWTLVIAFIVAFTSPHELNLQHNASGYLILLLIVIRIGWGFIGSYHAKFNNFVRSPRITIDYLTRLIEGTQPDYPGHNPAAAVMILALLFSLLMASFSGIMIDPVNSISFSNSPLPTVNTGQVNSLLPWRGIHRIFTTMSLMLIYLHVFAVVFMSITQHQNLITSMIHGRKKTAPSCSNINKDRGDSI